MERDAAGGWLAGGCGGRSMSARTVGGALARHDQETELRGETHSIRNVALRPNTLKQILLLDNGSLESASTLQLRRLAAELAARVGAAVLPVSLAHSEKVPVEALDGRRAELFEPALDRVLREGVDEIVVVPLFIGPSHAIVRHVPAVIAERRKIFPNARIELTPPLFVPGETRLAEILAAHVRELIERGAEGSGDAGQRPRVAIVDHGSPSRAVTAVRDAVAAQVRGLLGDEVADVAACSMERRAGPEFAFNDPRLETLLSRAEWRAGPVVIALMFIAPGKHAGAAGDVARIVARARGATKDAVAFTRVMGTHPLLVEILAERVENARRR